jgi:hypothetical protein
LVKIPVGPGGILWERVVPFEDVEKVDPEEEEEEEEL